MKKNRKTLMQKDDAESLRPNRGLFISPYQSLTNIGWQNIQLATMKNIIDAYAFNNVKEQDNVYNLNSLLNRTIRRLSPYINENVAYPLKLKQIVKRHKINFIACNFLDFALRFHQFIRTQEIPFLIFCHGRDIIWDYIDPKSGHMQYDKDFFKKLDLIKHQAYFIANSNFTKSQLEKVGVKPERIYIKYFGLEHKDIKKEERKKRSLRLLFVGRLIAWKGPVEVILAFIIAKEKGFKGTLTIIGGGSLEKECRRISYASKYNDQIFILGSKPHHEVMELYKEHDAVVAHQRTDPKTNQVEALGVSLIEGLSYGLPVVTCASGGVSDIISNGYNGFLTPQNDINAQALKFIELENNLDLYNQMSRNAIETVRTKFSKDVDKQRILDILEYIYSTKGKV
ncbi:glycosyltransferase family 4 protein [Pontibacter mangrovi]|uniref:Glycosyltransferase family 4 protein n=1 Tax=Pontibacter mangrovi TaxID=2589816 RepID=A0A501VUD6_9BACT|nr:glycosyltransferase family 4 protein [Pontibacter mangrovi]TPE40005.1 glycosyltransferase family 4 protein [Pontibacter mangrovi]